jgi:hypothetical protein
MGKMFDKTRWEELIKEVKTNQVLPNELVDGEGVVKLTQPRDKDKWNLRINGKSIQTFSTVIKKL